MNEMYLGVLISREARASVANERYLSMYTNMAANRTITDDQIDFVDLVRAKVQSEFGSHLNVSFYDGDAKVETVHYGQQFYLLVSAERSNFFSTKVH